MKVYLLSVALFLSAWQINAQSRIRNTDESKVCSYTLPDAFKKADGTIITTKKEWEKQREYWIEQFSEYMYGFTPKQKIRLRFEVLETKTDALNNLAIRKRVNIYFSDYPGLLPVELILYVPKSAKKPVPVFVSLNYVGNHGITNETDIPISSRWMPGWIDRTKTMIVDHKATELSRGMQTRRWPLETILSNGYAVATAYYGDIEPDDPEGWKSGIRSVLGDTSKANNWGIIGAWAWGMSRMLDYLETDRLVDAYRSIALGHSRLGKAALWAGAQDKRFAVVISNNSGEGGAALARRNFGDNILDYDTYRYCKNYLRFENREGDLPFDQHILLSLIAPRPLYVASASKDLMADPYGEFLSAVHAGKVYTLYGKTGLGTDIWPTPGEKVGETIGYHLREGVHDILLYDWEHFLNFADKALK